MVKIMAVELAWTNLWLFYLLAYVIGYSMQEWANHKRGEPFDDPEFLFSDKKIVVFAMIWIFGGLGISVLVPVGYGIVFYIGLPFYLLGLIIEFFTMYSFAFHKGLTMSGIHRFSRNPIYVGWLVVFLGLTLMGWTDSAWSFGFLGYFLLCFPYLHWTIRMEEDFLLKKYGENYREYLEMTPRYIGRVKKKPQQ